MQKEANTAQADLLHIQNSVDVTHNDNSPLIIHEEIENTPFTITGNKEKGYFVRMGKYRLTEYHKNKEDAIYLINWTNILTLICAIIDHDKQNPVELISK